MSKISVLGGGSWGTAIARLLAKNGNDVNFYIRNKVECQSIIENRENKKYLPGVELPENIFPTDSINTSIENCEIIVLAVPTNSVRSICEELSGKIDKGVIFVNLAKGLEMESHKRISEVVEEFFENPFVALSGPSHAEEVGKDIPTIVVVSSRDEDVMLYIQDVFSSEVFRVYTNKDLVGVEIGGALKNIIALGAGLSDGLGYGDNTKAALMTRGIYEMMKLGVKLGASPETFNGLAGIGDLIVTCTSMHSRNRVAGINIGKGLTVEETIEKVGMVVEGIKTTKSAYELSQIHGVEMPITTKLYKVLYEGASPRESVLKLMTRERKAEMESLFGI